MKAGTIIPIIIVIIIVLLALILLLPKKTTLPQDIKTSIQETDTGVSEISALETLTTDELDTIDSDLQEIDSLVEFF